MTNQTLTENLKENPSRKKTQPNDLLAMQDKHWNNRSIMDQGEGRSGDQWYQQTANGMFHLQWSDMNLSVRNQSITLSSSSEFLLLSRTSITSALLQWFVVRIHLTEEMPSWCRCCVQTCLHWRGGNLEQSARILLEERRRRRRITTTISEEAFFSLWTYQNSCFQGSDGILRSGD